MAAEKRRAKAAMNPPKKKNATGANRKKKKKKRMPPPPFPGFKNYYPPPGHSLEFSWDGNWIEATFLKMEIDADHDELCHVKDAEDGEVHHVLLREKNENDEWEDCNDWEPLFECTICEENTRGHVSDSDSCWYFWLFQK